MLFMMFPKRSVMNTVMLLLLEYQCFMRRYDIMIFFFGKKTFVYGRRKRSLRPMRARLLGGQVCNLPNKRCPLSQQTFNVGFRESW